MKKKKFLGKVSVAVLIFASLFIALVRPIIAVDKSSTKNYDTQLLEIGQQSISDLEIIPGRTFEVTLEKDVYTVNINGNIQKVMLPPTIHNKETIINVQDPNKKIVKIFNTSKEHIVAYIQGSTILKDKDHIIKQLDSVEVKLASIEYPALYENKTLYIGKDYIDVVCEWMICHELVHCLSEITNKGIENEPYAYNLFNEAITDIITFSMEPKIPDGYISGYTEYYSYIFEYIGCFGEKAISAYFYGYDELWNTVGKTDFDFWVSSFENSNTNEVALVCVNNFINQWAQTYAKQ